RKIQYQRLGATLKHQAEKHSQKNYEIPNKFPNASNEDAWRLIFYSLDDIAQGEELTFNYGFDPKHHTDDLVHEGNVETSERLLQPRNIVRHTHHAHSQNREHCLKLRSVSAPEVLLKPQEGD